MPKRRSSRRRETRAAGSFDHRRAESLLLRLLAIPGPSGQEGQVARFITERLVEAGLPAAALRSDSAHRRSPHRGEVGNLICRLPGQTGTARSGPARLLMAHMDTVPLAAGARPVVRRGFVYPADKQTALGADDRAGTAVVLATALELLERRPEHPPLTCFWTVQEEVGLHGARYGSLGLLGRPRLAFNFDGGSPAKLTIAATGGYRMTIDVYGHASHAGNAPERGVSAIAIAALAVADLHRGGWHGRIVAPGAEGTSNVGVVEGGDATNVVTAHVRMRAEARSHNADFRQQIVRTIEDAFAKAAREVRSADGATGRVEIDGRRDYEAFKLADDDPSVLAAERAVRAAGLEPLRAATNGGLDANWMTARGIPTVTLGCGQVEPHTTAERLDLEQFHQACDVAWRLATGP